MGLTGSYIHFEKVISEPFLSSFTDDEGNVVEEMIVTSSYEPQPPLEGAYVHMYNAIRGKETYYMTGSTPIKKTYLEVGYKVYNSYEDRLTDVDNWTYDIISDINLELTESNVNLWDKGYEHLLTLPGFVSMSQD